MMRAAGVSSSSPASPLIIQLGSKGETDELALFGALFPFTGPFSLTPIPLLPFFSTAPSLFLSIFPGKLHGNRQIFGSEPNLRLVWAQNQPNFRPNRQNAGGNFAENPCIPGNYPATAWVFVDFLNFASDFAPDQLSDSGKLASFQNGAPNTLCFPWKFPETQSAGDPLFSFLFSGKPCSAQHTSLSGPRTSRTPAAPARAPPRPGERGVTVWDGNRTSMF